jgi:hypothetical protein
MEDVGFSRHEHMFARLDDGTSTASRYARASSAPRGIQLPESIQRAEAPARYPRGMCRNIRTLHNFDPPASHEEVRASALQYVRKISGFTKPSQANAEAFERAVDAVTHASMHLLDELVTNAPPKDREVEAAKARARSAQRYAA